MISSLTYRQVRHRHLVFEDPSGDEFKGTKLGFIDTKGLCFTVSGNRGNGTLELRLKARFKQQDPGNYEQTIASMFIYTALEEDVHVSFAAFSRQARRVWKTEQRRKFWHYGYWDDPLGLQTLLGEDLTKEPDEWPFLSDRISTEMWEEREGYNPRPGLELRADVRTIMNLIWPEQEDDEQAQEE